MRISDWSSDVCSSDLAATGCSCRCSAAPSSIWRGWGWSAPSSGAPSRSRWSMRFWYSVSCDGFFGRCGTPRRIACRQQKAKGGFGMRRYLLTTAAALAMVASAGTAQADMEAAERWVDSEFQPSSLSKDEQMAELEWFIKAAEPIPGRSEERRVGEEVGSPCKYRWLALPY